MEFAIEMLQRFAKALLWLFVYPYYYLGLLLVLLQYHRAASLERKLFAVRLTSVWDGFWRSVGWGWLIGIVVSAAAVAAGVTVNASTVLFLWIVSVLLMLFRFRFAGFVYTAGVLGIVRGTLEQFPQLRQFPELDWLANTISLVSVPAMLGLVGALYALFAIFIRFWGANGASPLVVQGKRGKTIGAYHLQGLLPIPLFFLIPISGGEALTWQPLFGGDVWAGGWSMIAFPVLIGFAEITSSWLPQHQARLTAGRVFIFSIVLFVFALCSLLWPVAGIPVCVGAIVLYEMIKRFGRLKEDSRSPIYVHDDRGLFILAVLPGSPADQLGIKPGEIVRTVNGLRVQTKEQFHHALQTKPAFCRLDIINAEGEVRFLNRGLFEGEHHQLGIVLAPDEQAMYYASSRSLRLLDLVDRHPAEKRHLQV